MTYFGQNKELLDSCLILFIISKNSREKPIFGIVSKFSSLKIHR